MNTVRVSVKPFGSRSGPKFCHPDPCPNCLQKLPAEDKSRQLPATVLRKELSKKSVAKLDYIFNLPGLLKLCPLFRPLIKSEYQKNIFPLVSTKT